MAAGNLMAVTSDATVSYHDRVSKLQAFDHLARSPFDRSEWYGLLARFGAQPHIVIAGHEGKRAALPLTRTRSGLQSLNHWFAFAWRPLAEPGPEGDALLRTIAKDLRGQAPVVTLDFLPDEDGSATRLRAAFRAAGWLTRLEVRDTNHVLAVGSRDFATYWAQRPGAMRTTLKRKAKKVEVELLTEFDVSAWQAAQFWTVEHGSAFIHKLAYDQDHAKLSAGTTLSAALFAHVIDTDKVALVDFGTGEDGYKRDWMDTERPRYRLTCLDPRQPAAWRLVARKAADRLASHLRRG